jgi:dolichyl-phosphate beta-glucosyltransferase
MKYSIIIPVYNEERRVPKTIDQIFDFFKSYQESLEVIFVNDGSQDQTQVILEEYQKQYQFRVISYELNRGKGYAVKQGAMAAVGDWIIFFDIDLATPLTEFGHLLTFLKNDDEVVIGSRRLKQSNIKKYESGLRTFLGQGFTKLSNILVPGIKDFTCGFKCFSHAAVKEIFPRARIDRWGFDTELLYIAHLRKLSIRQMPVTWIHDDDSRVKVFKAVVSSFRELIQMLTNRWRGFYK